MITVNATALKAEMELRNDTTGLTFVQFFEVRNQGPSDILATTLQISLPVYTEDGDEILELLKQLTVTEGVADCQSVPLNSQEANTMLRYNGEIGTRAVVINCTTGRIVSNDRVVIRLSARLSPKGVINVKKFTIAYDILSKYHRYVINVYTSICFQSLASMKVVS